MELADSHLLLEQVVVVAAVAERGDRHSIADRPLGRAVGKDTKENVCSLISRFVVAKGMVAGGRDGRDMQIGAS